MHVTQYKCLINIILVSKGILKPYFHLWEAKGGKGRGGR